MHSFDLKVHCKIKQKYFTGEYYNTVLIPYLHFNQTFNLSANANQIETRVAAFYLNPDPDPDPSRAKNEH
jgi:hypothetical protein